MFESTSAIIAALSGASWVNLKLSSSTGGKPAESISNSATVLCSMEFIDFSPTVGLIRLAYGEWTKSEEWQLSKTSAAALPRQVLGSLCSRIPAKDNYCWWNESQPVYGTLVWNERKNAGKQRFLSSICLFISLKNSMSTHQPCGGRCEKEPNAISEGDTWGTSCSFWHKDVLNNRDN